MHLMTLDELASELGEPSNARRLPREDAEHFRGRVPHALVRFWTEHGFGSYKSGYFVICDPRPLDPVLATMFHNDPEFSAHDLTAVGYTGDSEVLLAWHRDGRKFFITLDQSLVAVSLRSADIDRETGRRWSDDELIGAYLTVFRNFETDLFDEACALAGHPAAGEIFGFVPALQLGGSPVAENMRHVKALEHISFLAQLEPLKLVEATPPEPGYPIGRNRIVRKIGGQT